MVPLLLFALIGSFYFCFRAAVQRQQKKPGHAGLWAFACLVLVFTAMAKLPDPATGAHAQSSGSQETRAESDDGISRDLRATVGGLGFEVLNVETHASITRDLSEPMQAQGEFIVLKLSVANNSKKAATVSTSDFHLERNGVTYDASNALEMKSSFFLAQLNPD